MGINTLEKELNQPYKTPEKSKIIRIPNLKLFTNQELVEYGIKEGLLEQGNSAKDLAEIFREYDQDIGDFMMKIVEYNIKSKRGKSGKNFSATGNVDGVFYGNPRDYLNKIKEKVRHATSKFDFLKTAFGIKKETESALASVLGERPNTYVDEKAEENRITVKRMNEAKSQKLKFGAKKVKERKFKKLLDK